MATVKAPLFSLDARGTVAGAIVFTSWRGRAVVRKHAIPSNPQSGLQTGVRSVFKYITQAWAALAATPKTHWEDRATADNITGLNAQVAYDVDLARRNLGWVNDPTIAAGAAADAPTNGVAAAAPKSLNVSWTRPAGAKGDYTVALYMSTVTGFTPGIENLIAVLDVATVAHTVKGLVTGTPYYFRVRETEVGGTLGALLAQFTGTPT